MRESFLTRLSSFAQLCDDALIDGMSPALRAVIERAHAQGASPRAIERWCKRAGASGMTLLAVEALCERLSQGGDDEPPAAA